MAIWGLCDIKTLYLYSRVSHIRNRFFGFSLLFYPLFYQKLNVSVSYEVVFYMGDSTVFRISPVLFMCHRNAPLYWTYRTGVNQDKTSELSKHWSPDSTPARNKVIMNDIFGKLIKCDKTYSN